MPGVPQHLKGPSFTRVAAWSRDRLEAEGARRRELRR